MSEINKARNAQLVAKAERYLATFEYFTFSSVTVMEVVRGYFLAARLDKLTEFQRSLVDHEVIPFSSSTAELAGKIDADLMRTGQPIGRADPMIAATALESDLVLVTNNTSHFARIQLLGYPLRIENWRGSSR